MANRSRQKRSGRLLVIGGNEDADGKHLRILPHLVEMAGGKNARLVVCSAPSAEPERKANLYRELFERIGVAEIHEAPLTNRQAAEAPELVEAVERATAVFFTGGDQLRLTSLIAGTRFMERIKERLFADGLTVAGTSAGAAAMSDTMIIGGPSDGTIRRSDVDLAPGLGLWRNTVVDTHFNQRGRVHRLLTVFGQSPQIMGIGIDEDTALEVTPGQNFTVLGSGAVTVFTGRVSHSSAPDVGYDQVLSLTDVVVHVLADGYGFDLKTLRPVLPDGRAIPPTAPTTQEHS